MELTKYAIELPLACSRVVHYIALGSRVAWRGLPLLEIAASTLERYVHLRTLPPLLNAASTSVRCLHLRTLPLLFHASDGRGKDSFLLPRPLCCPKLKPESLKTELEPRMLKAQHTKSSPQTANQNLKRKQNPKPKTQNPKLKTQNPNPKTRNPKPKTQNLKPKTQNPKPKTQNSKPKTQTSEAKTLNPLPDPKH